MLYPETMILSNHGHGTASLALSLPSRKLAIANRNIDFSLNDAIASTALGPVES
jgi:hypothetical protein